MSRFFSSKAIEKIIPLYNRAVLAGIQAIQSDRPAALVAAKYTSRYLIDSKEYPALPDLGALLGRDEGLMYRGMAGLDEVYASARRDYFEKKACVEDDTGYDLVAYVRANKNLNFLSFSPCIETVRAYALGLSLIPSFGNIMETSYPRVFTKPQKLLHLDRSLFHLYAASISDSTHIEDVGTYQPMTEMAENNNEITVILRSNDGQDWRPNFSTDVRKTVLIWGPGKVLNLFMPSTQAIQLDMWENPDFKKRALSVEVVLAPGPHMSIANEKAIELGLITEGERLLTLEDASAIWRNNDYEDFVLDETLQLERVPSFIKEGDEHALVDYVKETLQDLEKKGPQKSGSS